MLVGERYDLANEEFDLIKDLLPPERSGKPGNPWRSHRQVINGILWVLRTGVPWRDAPERYGPWKTLYDRYLRWSKDGTWKRILDALQAKARSLEQQALGRSRGGFSTKIHVLCEGQGMPIVIRVTAGQCHDSTQAAALLDGVCIGGGPDEQPRCHFDKTGGDKAYDHNNVRQTVEAHASQPVIAHRKLPNGQYPERAQNFDKETYRRRNVVERLIAKLKEYRRIATRYEKLAVTYLSTVIIGCIRIWMRDLLSDTA